MNEELKKKLASILYTAWSVCYSDEQGDDVHPCEYYSSQEVKNLAGELDIDTSDWEEY